METSRYIQEDNTSFKISQLFLVLGLGGIGISLLYNSIPVFILITLIPLFCVGGILLLRYPWLILFVIFTTNYFILGITRYIPIEGISVIMEILYMIALVLIFIQAALFQNIEWRRAFNILSIALCIWMGYCILEIINPTSSLERLDIIKRINIQWIDYSYYYISIMYTLFHTQSYHILFIHIHVICGN